MATFSTSAFELKYASGSSWSSGKARQGVYSGTRYEGAINFSGLSELDMSNIDITQIKLNVTFGPAGGDSRKNLTFYKATKNASPAVSHPCAATARRSLRGICL